MILDPTFMSSVFLILVAFGGSFLAALWLAVLVVAVLNLPGVLVYLILRPAHTLEEDYQKTLEEEALLASIEDQSLCPGCERRVKDDWQVCPNCHTKLKKGCLSCGKLMELPWNICPYCGTLAPGMKREGEQ